MSEADLALAALIFIFLLFCAGTFLLLFPSNIDRLAAWWEKKRAKPA